MNKQEDFNINTWMLLEEEDLVMPPAYLMDEILSQARAIKVVETPRIFSKKMQLTLYSMKIGAAVAFALVMLVIPLNLPDFSQESTGRLGQVPQATELVGEQIRVAGNQMSESVININQSLNIFFNLNNLNNGGNQQ